MSWTTSPMATALTDDGQMEAIGIISDGTAITCASGLDTHPLDANAQKSLIYIANPILSGRIGVVSAHIAVDAGISSDIGLLTDAAQASTKKWLRIAASDRKIKICDYLGNIKASSTSQVSTNTAALTEVVAIFDAKTLSTVWVALVIDGTEEIALDTGLTPAQFANATADGFGDWSAAGSNMGAKLYSRYAISRYTTTAGDAPHVAAYPRLKGAGGFALTSVGDVDQWSHDSASSVDDIDTSDGDTGRIYHIENDPVAAELKNLYHWSAANPFSGTETILFAQAKHVGKQSSAGKNYATALLKHGGTEQRTTPAQSPSTTYYGNYAHPATAPGGGAWATSHWDLTGGVSDMQVGGQSNKSSGVDTAAVWTYGRGVEAVYYTASLGLTTTPVAAATRRIFVC